MKHRNIKKDYRSSTFAVQNEDCEAHHRPWEPGTGGVYITISKLRVRTNIDSSISLNYWQNKQASVKRTHVQEGQYWFLMISTECTKMYSLLKNIDVTIAGSPVPKGQKINAKSTLSEFHFCCLAALCILETCYSMRALNILVFENRVCVQLSSWYEPNKNAIYLFIRLFLFISKVVSLKLEIAA